MDAFRPRARAGAFLVLVSISPVLAQSADQQQQARQLLATTRGGHEADVPCDRLTPDIGKALLGMAQQTRVDPLDRIRTELRLAVRAAECGHSDELLGQALNDLSDTLLGLGDFDRALETGRQSVTVHERLRDQPGLAEAWNRIGNVQERRDDPAALESFHRALDISASIDDRVGQARAWNNLANVHRGRGELQQALTYLMQALHVFEDLHDAQRGAVVTNNIGLIYFDRGDYDRALEYNARAIELNRQAGHLTRVAASLDSRANIYRALGAYRQALENFNQALEVRRAAGDALGVVETTHNIGLVHFSQGDYDLAIAAYKRALRLSAKLRDRGFEAEALMNIGAAAWRAGQRDRAVANLQRSLTISRATRIRSLQAEALSDLGQIALAERRTVDAARFLSSALAIYRAIPSEAGITDVWTSLASTRAQQRDYGAAASLARQAVENAKAHDQPALLWQAETVLGKVYKRLGRYDAARASFGDAIADIETLSAQTVAGGDLRQRFMEDKLSPYHESIALDVETHAAADAFELAERSKARVLSQLVGAGHVQEDAFLTPAEKRERARLAESAGKLNVAIEHARATDAEDAAKLRALAAARREAREALAAYEVSLRAAHPELGVARGTVAPITADQAKDVLEPGTAAIEFVFGEDAVFGMVLARHPSGRVVVTAQRLGASPRRLAAMSERLHDRIASRDFGFGQDARAMYDVLMRPFQEVLAQAHGIIVVPDGPLWNVPFQALIGPRGYVIESAAVSYAPSLTVLHAIAAVPRPPGRATLLAMGRAEFHAAGESPLQDLPQAEQQVRQIASLYGSDRAATFVGPQATESNFKAAAPHYRVLHLATHGIIDETSPLYSHLVLGADPSGGDDGRLEAWELMRLKLSADLVVLAACDTGRGRIAAGEGVIGMMWALFAAGARAMVVSQFAVEADSATATMIAFHRRLAAGASGKAAQLRAAALELLHTPRYAHPYYWAGFVLVGDPE